MKQTLDRQEQTHKPVLLNSVIAVLGPKKGESYLDLTAGYGGHAAEVFKYTEAPQKAVLVDRDKQAVDFLSQHFAKNKVQILHSDFYEAAKELLKSGRQFDLILADLGLSSPHLEKASRGFSISNPGPLDMRMDQRQDLTADKVVNEWDIADLLQIIRLYGEEPRANKIAQAIINSRPITSTAQLGEVIAKAASWRPGKIHPATRVFQAIRIAVNDELELLEKALPLLLDLLAEQGRIAIISFHSLEDRLVKQAFKDRAEGQYSAELKLLTKNPISANHDEIVFNPRSRSAKLRAAAKIKIPRHSSGQEGS